MRSNLLPTMQNVKLTDRKGEEFFMFVELRKVDDKTYVFMSDGNPVGASVLARDAVFYLKKISQRLGLNVENTIFYRHIFQEQMGSLFGRFNVDWKNNETQSYQFKMLTNIDDLAMVKDVIDSSEPIQLSSLVSLDKAVA